MNNIKVPMLEAILVIEKWLVEKTCQIFCSITKKIEPEGSGFLIEVYGLKLLVTAGHVIMNEKLNYLFVPNKNGTGFTFLNGDWCSSDKSSNVGQDHDDFAYLLLDDQTIKSLYIEGYNFVKSENIDDRHRPSSDRIYTILGFRCQKTIKKGHDHYARTEIITNYGSSDSFYNNDFTKKRNIQISNDRKLFITKNKQKGLTGRLVGMSGGPMWHTDIDNIYHHRNPTVKLVGIANTFDSDVIIGTNINRLYILLKERGQARSLYA